ncbi:MAG: c-type cytochrome domain-containing protein, partial [Planctomycetales bacterium]
MRRLIERVFLFLPLAAALLAFRPSLQAADPSAAAAGAFDARVAPVLARRCLECHNGSQREGGLDLTRRATALAGGDSGAALVPGKLDESYLWQRVSAGEMPPEDREPVSAEERAILEQWIAAGAAWGSDPIDRFRYTSDKRAGRDWWAFQPIRRPELPAVKDAAWPRNEIDHFILARL